MCPQSGLSLTSSWPLFVSQHADVLAKTLTQCDGHGAHAAKLKTHICIKSTTLAINIKIYHHFDYSLTSLIPPPLESEQMPPM